MMRMKQNKTNGTNVGAAARITPIPAFAAIMLWIFALLLAPTTAHAQTSVNNLTDLLAEIENAPTDGTEKVITLTAAIAIQSGTTTLKGAIGSNIKIMRGIESASNTGLFAVSSDAVLILEDIIIDGDKGT